MMKFPWTIRKKPKTSAAAEEKLELIKQLLFPDLELEQEMDKDGTIYKFHIDKSVDSNIDAALMDLEEGFNDRATQQTLRNIGKRLFELREILEVNVVMHKDAKYLVVDDGVKEEEVQAVE